MAEEEEQEQEGKKKKADKSKESMSPKKKAIVIAVVITGVLIVQIGTAFVFVKWIKGDDPSVAAIEKLEMDEREKLAQKTRIGTVLGEALPVTVNIAGSGGTHYLKSEIQLEWDGEEFPELVEKIEERRPKIKDIIIDILSTQSINDLYLASGKQRIREAIKSEINMILPEEFGMVNDVFFQEFIIQ
jgi:flagellar FliL protein